ncbi:MAG: response regulator [Methylotenera sp.]|nr:MAG: response regulator [Methylotenera sp.]
MISTQRYKPHILLVEDERTVLSLMQIGLTAAGYICKTAESVDEAEQIIKKEFIPKLVVLDQAMPGKDGLILAEYLSAACIPFIMLTAFDETAIIDKASELGALGYLVKPISVKQLIPAIEAALVRAEELMQLKVVESQLKVALNGDRDIGVAIGIMMAKYGIEREVAFEKMRSSARKQSKKITDLAKELITSETKTVGDFK